jgi:hypothetical protein
MKAKNKTFGYDYEPEKHNGVATIFGHFDNKTGQWFCGRCKKQLIGGGSKIENDTATIIPTGGSRLYVRFKEMVVLCGNCFTSKRVNIINYLAINEEFENRITYDLNTKKLKEDTLMFKVEQILQSDEFKKIKPDNYEGQRRHIERKIRSFSR